MPREAEKRFQRTHGSSSPLWRAQDGDDAEGELAARGIAYCPEMPEAAQQSPDSADVPPRIGNVRRRRVLVLAMLAVLLGAVVLGRE